MSDHPRIAELWTLDENSPSYLAKAPMAPSKWSGSSRAQPRHRDGTAVGGKFDNGNGKMYWRVCAKVDGKVIQPLAHRVVWILVNGPIPDGMTVDHVDNDGLNNRPSNLRLASKSEQARNRRVMSNSSTGLKGVRANQYGGFEAGVTVEGKRLYLGTFPSKELAYEAYCEAAQKIHGLFHRPV